MPGAKIAAAVDFGTSKIACVIGSAHRGVLQVLGSGTAAYEGFRDMHWLREDNVSQALSEALQEAEKQAGVHCREFYVGIPGEFTRVVFRRIEENTQSGIVTEDDLADLRAQAPRFTISAGEKIVRVRNVAWMVDDKMFSVPPVGEKGKTVVGFYSVVIATEEFFRSIEKLFSEAGFSIVGFIPSVVALAALASSSETAVPGDTEEKTRVIVDAGHYSTDVIISQFGQVVDTRNIREGGFHLTQDLSKVLHLSMEEASFAKARCSVGVKNPGNGFMKIVIRDESVTIDAELAREVLEARIDDIASRVRMEMQNFGLDTDQPIHLVLTGCGLGQVRGAREYLSQQLGSTVRSISQGTSQAVSSSEVTASAILKLVLQKGSEHSSGGLLDRLKNLFVSKG